MNRNKKIGFTFFKNEIIPSIWINRFINKLTLNGEKEKLEVDIYKLFIILKKNKINVALMLFYVFEVLRPLIYLKPYTSRGKVKLIPSHLGIEQQYNRALTWFTDCIKKSTEKTLKGRFLREVFKIVFYKRSAALKQKRRVYKTIIKNRTLINFKF